MSWVLLLEDDAELGQLTYEMLSYNWDVTWVRTIEEARAEVGEDVYDVCVFDRRLPDGDATGLVVEMRARGIGTPVLMLTAHGELKDRVSGLDSGANDYLVKPFEFEELEARLRALTRQVGGVSIAIGGWSFLPARQVVVSPYTGRIQLTEKESALLEVLATHPEQAFTRAQLLGAVFERGDSESVVDTYVHYVRKKTEKDLIATVRGVGYQLGTPA